MDMPFDPTGEFKTVETTLPGNQNRIKILAKLNYSFVRPVTWSFLRTWFFFTYMVLFYVHGSSFSTPVVLFYVHGSSFSTPVN